MVAIPCSTLQQANWRNAYPQSASARIVCHRSAGQWTSRSCIQAPNAAACVSHHSGSRDNSPAPRPLSSSPPVAIPAAVSYDTFLTGLVSADLRVFPLSETDLTLAPFSLALFLEVRASGLCLPVHLDAAEAHKPRLRLAGRCSRGLANHPEASLAELRPLRGPGSVASRQRQAVVASIPSK